MAFSAGKQMTGALQNAYNSNLNYYQKVPKSHDTLKKKPEHRKSPVQNNFDHSK